MVFIGWLIDALWPMLMSLVSFVVRVLSTRIGLFVSSALVWLGLSWTSYTFGVSPLRTLISNEMGSAGFLVEWLGYFGVDKAVTITLSAIAAKFAVGGARAFLTHKGT